MRVGISQPILFISKDKWKNQTFFVIELNMCYDSICAMGLHGVPWKFGCVWVAYGPWVALETTTTLCGVCLSSEGGEIVKIFENFIDGKSDISTFRSKTSCTLLWKNK